MIYMIPKIITVGDIYGNSVILTVMQKTIKAGTTGESKKRIPVRTAHTALLKSHYRGR